MHHTGPLPLTFKGPKQDFGNKIAKMQVMENAEETIMWLHPLLSGGMIYIATRFPQELLPDSG